MKNLLEKNFTRRNFLTTSAKILAATSLLGILPNEVEAAKKSVTVPVVKEFKTLDELEINTVPFLEFDEMDKRTHTGAIVIHHAGMSVDRDMTVQSIHDLHRNVNRWSGIGYHFVIHKDGIIEHGRPIDVVGAHALSNNEFTLGICLTGNYELGNPPQEQLYSAVQLISALCNEYNFEANDMTIFGHRDFGGTSCPGKNLYKLLPGIIENVNKIL